MGKYTKAHALGVPRALRADAYKYWAYHMSLFVSPRGELRVLGALGRVPIGFFVGTCAPKEPLSALHVHACQSMLME